MLRLSLTLLLLCALATPASAIVGGGGAPAETIGRSVVTIVGSHGTSCTGSLIARDLVLTAAHCIAPDTTYKLVDYASTPLRLLDVRRVAIHPQFNMQSLLAHRATADVALLQLAAPSVGSKAVAMLASSLTPITVGMRLTVIGMGVAQPGNGASGGVARAATLAVTGKPGTLQVRLVDALANNSRAGLGACTGDSGAPAVLAFNGGSVIVGVVSWSTGPNNSSGCGGLTGVTPLVLYRDWILKTAAMFGSPLLPPR